MSPFRFHSRFIFWCGLLIAMLAATPLVYTSSERYAVTFPESSPMQRYEKYHSDDEALRTLLNR